MGKQDLFLWGAWGDLERLVDPGMSNQEVPVLNSSLVEVPRSPGRVAPVDVASVGHHRDFIDGKPQAYAAPESLEHLLAVGDKMGELLDVIKPSELLKPPRVDKMVQGGDRLNPVPLGGQKSPSATGLHAPQAGIIGLKRCQPGCCIP